MGGIGRAINAVRLVDLCIAKPLDMFIRLYLVACSVFGLCLSFLLDRKGCCT